MRYIFPQPPKRSTRIQISRASQSLGGCGCARQSASLSSWGELGAATVNVTYNDRVRDLPTDIIRDGKTTQTHLGETLIGFWMPNHYATLNGYWTWYLREDALSALEAAQREFVSRDMSLVLTDAYRSYDVQMKAHQEKPNLAIHPDKSNHPKGTAVDITIRGGDQGTLEEVMRRHGWHRTVSYEPWHFDFKGEISYSNEHGVMEERYPQMAQSGADGGSSLPLLMVGAVLLYIAKGRK